MVTWPKGQLAEISEEVFSDAYLHAFRENHALIDKWQEEWVRRYPGQYVLIGSGVLILVTEDTEKLHDFIDKYTNVVVRKLPVQSAPPV